jgi:DNA-binding response OmpR family regulator
MLSTLKIHSILYVEDELDIQANIAEYLRSYFGSVYVASQGEEALSLYHSFHPDVLLLDINLPLLDGLSVAKEIRKNNKSIKIIMLTAFTETEKLLRATELKLTKYLVKPIAPKVFKNTLRLLGEELLDEPTHLCYLSDTCIWDKKHEKLSINNIPVLLLEKEHRLLKLLIAQQGETVTYEEIMVELWEDAYDRAVSMASVKNKVSNLRKKLPDNTIDTVYSKGYILK